MKQYLSRQLWMLAILLFAGVGNAFAQTNNISVDWDNTVANVDFFNQDGDGQMPLPSGKEWALESGNGKNYLMEVYLINPMVYSFNSVTIDGIDVTNTTFYSWGSGGTYIFEDLSTDHNVNISFDKVDDIKTVTVNFDDSKGSVRFLDPVSYIGVGVGNGVETELPEGSTIRMIIEPKVGWKLDKITIDNDNNDVTTTYNENNYYEFQNLSDNHSVNVVFAEVMTYTITPTYDNSLTWVSFDNGINTYGADSGQPSVFNAGSKVTMIMPDNVSYKTTISVDGGPYFTPNINYDRYEYVFDDGILGDNHTVNVQLTEVATHTITVANYSEVANILNNIWIGNSWIDDTNTSIKFSEGSNVTMTISCRNNLYSVSIVDNGGNPIPLNINQYGEYEYVFDNGSLNGDHSVSIVLTKAATNTITVTGGGNNVDVAIRENVSENSWRWINPASSGVWELLSGEGTKYRMSIGIPNYWVYDLGSVTLDGTTDITNSFNSNGHYDFENLSADHTVAIVLNKVANTNTITVNYDDGKIYNVVYYDPENNRYLDADNGVATELPSGSTIRLMIESEPGWTVKTLKVDGVAVEYNGSYYEFTNLSANHTVNIEYEKAETQKITVAYDTDHTNDVYLNNRWVANNGSKKFNKGSDVTMRIDCEDGYKPVLTIDNGNPITLDKNQDGQYKYVFSNLSTDHSVSIAYEAIIYHTITVNTNNDRVSARLNTAQNEYNWIQLGVENKFEEGEDVTLILNMEPGYALNKLMDGETDITDVYKANNYYTFSNLGSDHVVNATIDEVTTYLIQAEFDEYSQGTIYMESAMMSKRETYYQDFNVGSDVTLFVEPAIGYEVSKIVLEERDTNEEQEPEEVNFTEEDGLYKFTISGLSKNYVVTITTQKKSMAGIDPIAFTLDDTGMCTYCSEYDLDFTNVSGITAYIANGFNSETGSVVMNEVDKVPAGTGLLIKGKPGNYSIPVVETNSYNTNMLTGIVKPKQIPTSVWADIKYTNFTLQSDGVFRIVNYSNNQLDAHKAYLRIPHNLLQNTSSQIKIEWGALKGDVNNDGVVDITDAVIIVNFIVGNNSNF